MAFCGEASTWGKVAMLMTVVAVGLQAAGYGTNYWMARYTVREKMNFGIGLWKMTNCSGYYNAPCTDADVPDTYNTKFLTVTRVMASLSFVLMFVCMVCLLFYVGSQRSRTRGMAIAVMTMLFITASFGITGMVVWVIHCPEYHYPSWSFGLTVFAATLNMTAAILLIPDIREYDYKDILKVGGEFKNLPVTTEDPPPAVPTQDLYHRDIKPVVEPQGPNAAPAFQFLQYNRKKRMDGF